MTRRQKGSGTVVKRRNKWYARIRRKDRPDEYSEPFSSKQEALKALETLLTGVNPRFLPTFEQHMLRLLEGEYQDRYDPATVRLHETFYRLRIKGTPLGRMRLDAIKRGHVQDLIDKNRSRYAPSSLRRLLSCVHAALEHACEELEMIPRNPAKKIKLPPEEDAVHCVLAADQAHRLPAEIKQARVFHKGKLTASDWHRYQRLAAMVTVIVDAGLRPGEACGIRWQDLDPKARTLFVRYAIGRDGSIRKTKTKKARLVELTSDALAAILAQPRTDKFVFTALGGGPVRPSALSLQFLRLRDRLGYPSLSMRDLRKTFATIGVQVGDMKATQALLGHATAQMTMDVYAKAERAAMKRTVEEIEKKVGKRRIFGDVAEQADTQADLGI